MSEYKSFLSVITSPFIEFMRASQHWSDFYEETLKYFDTYLAKEFPDALELSQEILFL